MGCCGSKEVVERNDIYEDPRIECAANEDNNRKLACKAEKSPTVETEAAGHPNPNDSANNASGKTINIINNSDGEKVFLNHQLSEKNDKNVTNGIKEIFTVKEDTRSVEEQNLYSNSKMSNENEAMDSVPQNVKILLRDIYFKIRSERIVDINCIRRCFRDLSAAKKNGNVNIRVSLTDNDIMMAFVIADPANKGFLDYQRFLRFCVLLDTELEQRQATLDSYLSLLASKGDCSRDSDTGLSPSDVLQWSQVISLLSTGILSNETVMKCFTEAVASPSRYADLYPHPQPPPHATEKTAYFAHFCAFLDNLAHEYQQEILRRHDNLRKKQEGDVHAQTNMETLTEAERMDDSTAYIGMEPCVNILSRTSSSSSSSLGLLNESTVRFTLEKDSSSSRSSQDAVKHGELSLDDLGYREGRGGRDPLSSMRVAVDLEGDADDTSDDSSGALVSTRIIKESSSVSSHSHNSLLLESRN